ncbi:MAG TPA: formate dehydrogenase accessory sulfurtransferase FdhD [Saprospiraceae bacterium]|nr:formate dehydrogenase accessory sulfurtransferase FdhD [Saprospiraceae bacterium]
MQKSYNISTEQKAAVARVKVDKVFGSEWKEKDDLLAVEEPLEIRLGYGDPGRRSQQSIAVTMRTPGYDFELALGFLYTEGILQNYDDILKIQYCTESNTREQQFNVVRVELKEHVIPDMSLLQRNFYMNSSCGVCGKASIESIKISCPVYLQEHEVKISGRMLNRLPEILKEHQRVFMYTGGLHASALFDHEGHILLHREDVGRHNALDKLIGAALAGYSLKRNTWPLAPYILLLSGRISFELVQKAAMAGIRIICAVGAPSSLAVETAKEFNMTIVGFLKDDRYNVYHGIHRLAL